MNILYDNIDDYLQDLKGKNLLRTIKSFEYKNSAYIEYNNKKYINFSSNDYLGLSSCDDVIQAGIESANMYGSSSSSSRIVVGSPSIYESLEIKLANFKGKESALLFNTGFQLSSTLMLSLTNHKIAGKKPLIITDKLIHASFLHGIASCSKNVTNKRFKHNDVNSLKKILNMCVDNYTSIFIVIESVYSMDGDIAPIKEISFLAKKFNAVLIVDEAHTTGVMGKNGRGLSYGLDVDMVMGTLSKGLASQGAFIACSEKLKQYLINSCRGLIYSTSLNPFSVGSAIKSLELVKERHSIYRSRSLKYIDQVKKAILSSDFIYGNTESHIIPLIIGNNDKVLKVQKYFLDKGIWVVAIREPTVPKNTARIRIIINYNHSQDNIDKLCRCIKNI